MTIAPWFMVSTQVQGRNAASIELAVKQLSTNPKIDFASPVFVGMDGGPLVVTSDILVGFHPSVDAARAEAILAASGAGALIDRNWGGMKGAYRLRSSSRDGYEVLGAANRLAEMPEVAFAEPDMMFTGRNTLIPNDTFFGDIWGIHNTGQFGGVVDRDMDGPEAWDITTGDPSIIVVIIDNGVEPGHPDLNLYLPGFDATGQGGGGAPVNMCDNHGTPVAGCVSSVINNSLGMVGIAPDCRSASARPFISSVPCDGSWSSVASWTVDALTYAESIGARVTNNSNYYGFTSAAINSKYSSTRANGIVHFSSAGNDNSLTITYPANLPTVNAVAALDPDGTLTSFSNRGVGLDFSAPGINVGSTDRTGSAGYVSGDYVMVQGTSFASPYTAGVAALILTMKPTLTAAQVECVMQRTAVNLGVPGYDTTFGWGFVNAYNGVSAMLTPSPAARGDDVCAAGPNMGGSCSTNADCSGSACGTKNRYISTSVSVDAAACANALTFLQVTAVSLPPSLAAMNGQVWWAGAPFPAPATSTLGEPTFKVAPLECTGAPHSRDWSAEGLVNLYGAIVVPGATYEIRNCASTTGPCSPPLTVSTAVWGDVAAPFGAGQPNFGDISAVVGAFQGAPTKSRTQLQPNVPNPMNGVNFGDISACVTAFQGGSYPNSGQACP